MKTWRIVAAALVPLLGLACSATEGPRAYTSGAAMRGKATVEGVANTARIIYQVPATDRVRVARGVQFAKNRIMDLYYPPDYDPPARLPAVVIATVYDKTTSGRQIGWGLLLASHGLIAVTYAAPYPDRDVPDLFRYLHASGESLGIEAGNLGILSWCSHCNVAAKILSDVSESYNADIRYAALLYGTIPAVAAIRPGQELLVVRAGRDTAGALTSLDAFVERTRSLGASVEVIDYPKGVCGFDFTETVTTFSVFITPAGREQDVEVIKTVLQKIQEHMLSPA